MPATTEPQSLEKPEKAEGSPNLAVRLILLASLVLLLLTTLTETALEQHQQQLQTFPPQVKNLPIDELIVPGTRVGPVVLGSDLSRLRSFLGEGQLRPEGDGFIHLYPKHGLMLYTEGGKILAVTVRSPKYETRAGVKVGSDVDLVLRTMSTNYEIEGDPGRGRYVLRDWENGWQAGLLEHKVEYLYLTPKLTVVRPAH